MKNISRIIRLFSAVGLGCILVALIMAVDALAALEAEADLGLELRAPNHIAPDQTFVINLAYSNTGQVSSAEDTVITVTLPEQVEFVSASNRSDQPLPPDDIQNNVLVWQTGPLTAGECCQHILITVQANADLPEDGSLTSQAAIASSAPESNLSNNVAEETSYVCDMAGSSKTVEAGSAMPGDVLTYTLIVRMAQRNGIGGGQQARQVTLTDTLPAAHQVRFLGWVGENQGELDGQQLRWQGQVQAGQAFQLQYRLGIEGDIEPGTFITNGLLLGWQGGRLEVEPVTTQIILPQHARMIGPGGSLWQQQDGVAVEVPPQAVDGLTRFEYRSTYTGTAPMDGPAGWNYAWRAFELNAFRFGEVNQFGQAITITVPLDPQNPSQMAPERLRLWYREQVGEPWKLAGAPVQTEPGYLTFQTTHFTEFALFSEPYFTLHLPLIAGR